MLHTRHSNSSANEMYMIHWGCLFVLSNHAVDPILYCFRYRSVRNKIFYWFGKSTTQDRSELTMQQNKPSYLQEKRLSKTMQRIL